MRYRKLETGDLQLKFFENDFNTHQTEKTDGTSVRAGLRQDFGPAFTLLASYMHADKTIDFGAPNPDLAEDFSIDREEKSDSLEGQLLFRGPRVKVVGGRRLLRHRFGRDHGLRHHRPRVRVHRHRHPATPGSSTPTSTRTPTSICRAT